MRDRAVGADAEPLRVLTHPGVVRRALQRQVQRDLDAVVARLGDEVVEVLDAAEVGMDRVMTALVRADRPHGSGAGGRGVGGSRGRGVVGALAMGEPDRVDRRQVDDVEPHVGDGWQPLGGGAERARTLPAVGAVEDRPFGAGEELVPRSDQGAPAVHREGEPAGACDEVA